jgi:prepilin-type N-terminal cleavage/methylation domain-containing protein
MNAPDPVKLARKRLAVGRRPPLRSVARVRADPTHPRSSIDPARLAFTLIEMLVVVVIISILASAIVPRMINVGQRQAEIEAKSVQRLVSVAAEKCDVWNQPVAVDFNAEKNALTVWSQREDPKATSDAVGAARVRWQIDPLVETVAFGRLKISQATQDGQPLASTKWRVSFTPGQPRPVLSIELAPKTDRDGPRWTVVLGVGETAATCSAVGDAVHPAGPNAVGAQSRSIDLDDAGKGQTKW